jgi:hypothetical protein
LLGEKDDSVATQLLEAQGVRLAAARAIVLASSRAEGKTGVGAATPAVFVADARTRIAGLKRLLEELMRTPRDSPEANRLSGQIEAELDALSAIFD